MALHLPLCFFNRHTPDRRRVTWDGMHYVGTCRFCGEHIRRREHAHWLRDWLEPHRA